MAMRQAMKRMKNRMERRTERIGHVGAAGHSCGLLSRVLKGDSKRGGGGGRGGKKRREEVGEGVTNDVIEAEGDTSLSLSLSRRGSRIIESYDCGRQSRDPVGRFVRTAAIFSPRLENW